MLRLINEWDGHILYLDFMLFISRNRFCYWENEIMKTYDEAEAQCEVCSKDKAKQMPTGSVLGCANCGQVKVW